MPTNKAIRFSACGVHCWEPLLAPTAHWSEAPRTPRRLWVVACGMERTGSGSVPTPSTWFAGCALVPLQTLQKTLWWMRRGHTRASFGAKATTQLPSTKMHITRGRLKQRQLNNVQNSFLRRQFGQSASDETGLVSSRTDKRYSRGAWSLPDSGEAVPMPQCFSAPALSEKEVLAYGDSLTAGFYMAGQPFLAVR